MSSLSVTQLQRARDFISALGAYQYDSFANLLSEDFTHRFLPTTLNGLGMPVRNTQEFLDLVKAVELSIEEFNVSLKWSLSVHLLQGLINDILSLRRKM
jgi:hypothetical protein